jgi:hypothetical protein
MKFEDLKFKPHPLTARLSPTLNFPSAVQAFVEFPNGWGVSVVGGGRDRMLYGDGKTTFEVARLKDGKVYGDVEGWQTKK